MSTPTQRDIQYSIHRATIIHEAVTGRLTHYELCDARLMFEHFNDIEAALLIQEVIDDFSGDEYESEQESEEEEWVSQNCPPHVEQFDFRTFIDLTRDESDSD